MIHYEIIENTINLKSKERFIEDSYLNKLTSIIVDYNGSYKLHNLVRDMLYVKSLTEYEAILTKNLIMYEIHHEIIFEIYNLFTTWLPFEKYNLGELRGNFLEILVYKYMQQTGYENIYRESHVTINGYKSYT